MGCPCSIGQTILKGGCVKAQNLLEPAVASSKVTWTWNNDEMSLTSKFTQNVPVCICQVWTREVSRLYRTAHTLLMWAAEPCWKSWRKGQTCSWIPQQEHTCNQGKFSRKTFQWRTYQDWICLLQTLKGLNLHPSSYTYSAFKLLSQRSFWINSFSKCKQMTDPKQISHSPVFKRGNINL